MCCVSGARTHITACVAYGRKTERKHFILIENECEIETAQYVNPRQNKQGNKKKRFTWNTLLECSSVMEE